jgi:hypothetical protein
MCVGVIALHGLVQTFLKEASGWPARKQEQTYQCVGISVTDSSYKLQC